jgi:hypothetical protein
MRTVSPLTLAIAATLSFQGCRRPEATVYGTEAAAVLRQCDIKDVTSPRVLAWMADNSKPTRVAIVGRRGLNHVLIIAFCSGRSANPSLDRWDVAEVSFMRRQGEKTWCEWIRADREFDHVPGMEDLRQLCEQLQWHDADLQWQSSNPP